MNYCPWPAAIMHRAPEPGPLARPIHWNAGHDLEPSSRIVAVTTLLVLSRSSGRAGAWRAVLLGAALFGAQVTAQVTAQITDAQAAEARHALAMHGEPAMPAGFTRLPYADPEAPKGGRFVQGVLGTFDSLNPLIVRG